MSVVAIRALVVSLLVLAASSPVRAQGAVLVVKPSGAPFATIQTAIAAAADGDTIYVHQGTYAGLSVEGRSLTIAGAEGEIVKVGGDYAKIQDLQPDDVVVLRGLQLRGLHVSSSAGTVWIEDCQVLVTIPALIVESSASVVFVRCDIEGPDAFTDATSTLHPSGIGARLSDSVVAMFDCTVKGGNGQDFHPIPSGTADATAGDDGLELHGGALHLSGGSVQGGKGGNGPMNPAFGCAGEDGGDGVFMADGSPSLVVNDVAIAGGAGGTAPSSCPGGQPEPGDPGEAILVQSGSAETIPGTARLLALGGPAIENHVVNLEVAGVPGDVVLLLIGLQPGLVPKPAHGGALLVPAPLLVTPLGVLGDPAQVDLPFVVPELGPGVATVHACVQGVFKPTAGAALLGSGSLLIALDSVY